jgi:hypothetical protein
VPLFDCPEVLGNEISTDRTPIEGLIVVGQALAEGVTTRSPFQQLLDLAWPVASRPSMKQYHAFAVSPDRRVKSQNRQESG